MAGVANEVTALAQIKDRRLFIQDRRRFDASVAKLDDRWDYEIVVQRLYANRSLQQNAWYWGVIVEAIAEHTGYTADETHDILKMKFIPKRLAVCDGNGEVQDEFVVGGSTRKMTTSEFGDYCESIRQWAAETLDIDIPDPDSAATSASASRNGYGHGV